MASSSDMLAGWFSRLTRARALTITIVISLALLIIWQLHHTGVPSFSTKSPANPSGPTGCAGTIPNVVHYVYVLKDGATDIRFQFKHFLGIYAAHLHLHPDIIYLHTDAPQSVIDRARNGDYGKWTRLVLTHFPQLRINHVTPPTRAGNWHMIHSPVHRSDFVRREVVHAFGGVYLDFDAHPLRDLRALRTSGFAAVFGRQFGGEINNGVFMAQPGTQLLEIWGREMHRVYDGGWATHGNGVLTRLIPRLMRQPGEVLLLEQNALQPGSWNKNDSVNLFMPHDDVEPTTLVQGQPLPTFDEEPLDDRWMHPEKYPKWERDYSDTFVLHAFDPRSNKHDVKGFTNVTPRYVLERTSNYGRALYHVVKHMYGTGLIGIDDAHDA